MTYQLQNASILVVDDMKPMLDVTVSILKIFGFKRIYASNNTIDAFAQFCQQVPDIVLTDWQMEPQDGMELIEMIRNDPRSPNPFVPIILMTGYSARPRVTRARDTGVTEFLAKPFMAKDLYARIEQLIENPRKFIDAKQFFGPDRRRRKNADYEGPRRRNTPDDRPAEEARKPIGSILSKLKGQAPKPEADKDV